VGIESVNRFLGTILVNISLSILNTKKLRLLCFFNRLKKV
jgi:hypothetical protein